MSLSRRGFLGVLAGVLAAPAAILAAKSAAPFSIKPTPGDNPIFSMQLGEYKGVKFYESVQIPTSAGLDDHFLAGKDDLAAWFGSRFEEHALSHAAGK